MPHIKTSDQKGTFNLGFNDYVCNRGTHICGFYKTAEERDEMLFGYLHAGNIPTDFVLIGVEPEEQKTFLKRLENFYPEDKEFVEKGEHCIIAPNKDLYYPDGTFSPWEMELALSKTYQEALSLGCTFIRGLGDMRWALEGIPGVEYLMAYEARLNMFVSGKSWVSFCLYDIKKFSGEIIIQALQTHPFVVNAGVLTENPYFIDPEVWLKNNAPRFLSPHPHQH